MSLRIFPAAGEALNFGFRRMETIARISWLPAVLIGVVQLATVFGLLSIMAGRAFTFTDLTEQFGVQPSFEFAKQALFHFFADSWNAKWPAMGSLIAISALLHLMLTTSIVSPLTRYAATGEKPPPGAYKVLFGPGEVRFLIASLAPFALVGLVLMAPVLVTGFYAIKYIVTALSETVILFPDPESLHTVEVSSLGAASAGKPIGRLFSFTVPLIAAAPFAGVLWFLLYQHFHPKNRPGETGSGNWLMRAATIILVTGVLITISYSWLGGDIGATVKGIAGKPETPPNPLEAGPSNVGLFLTSVSWVLFSYINLRLYAYPGVAVATKSMSIAGALRVTRGWGILKLLAILLVLGFFWSFLQIFVINGLLLGTVIPGVVSMLYNVSAVSSRLVNSGVTAEWILPVWIWIWNGAKFLVNILWMFFTYGLQAGLYGRLAREAVAAQE